MTQFTHVIKDEIGIHARPAGTLAKFAATFDSKITVKKGDKSADAKKLFGLMGLAAKCGEELVFTVEGENEAEHAKKLEEFCNENI